MMRKKTICEEIYFMFHCQVTKKKQNAMAKPFENNTNHFSNNNLLHAYFEKSIVV